MRSKRSYDDSGFGEQARLQSDVDDFGLAARGQPGAAVPTFLNFCCRGVLAVPRDSCSAPNFSHFPELLLFTRGRQLFRAHDHFVDESFRAGFGELLNALMDVQNRLRERQAASLFEDRN
jgi:hypothetical protein